MKKISSLILITTICFLFTFSNSFSQTYQFLNLDLSARAAALGGTFVANNDDPDVIFYNPAGIGLLEKNPISFSFVKHLLDINLASLSYSTDWKGVGRIGAAVSYINYGKLLLFSVIQIYWVRTFITEQMLNLYILQSLIDLPVPLLWIWVCIMLFPLH